MIPGKGVIFLEPFFLNIHWCGYFHEVLRKEQPNLWWLWLTLFRNLWQIVTISSQYNYLQKCGPRFILIELILWRGSEKQVSPILSEAREFWNNKRWKWWVLCLLLQKNAKVSHHPCSQEIHLAWIYWVRVLCLRSKHGEVRVLAMFFGDGLDRKYLLHTAYSAW